MYARRRSIIGVVYKLTPEIRKFIIEQKQSQPRLTCQGLSMMVAISFNRQVSKSSVHELLKQTHTIVPRERKIKEKFQIPQHKKEQISKELASFMPRIMTEPRPIVPAQTAAQEIPQEKIKIEMKPGQGNIFLKAALWDLSFKPVLGIADLDEDKELNNPKLKFEWMYFTGHVVSIKVDLEDGGVFYLDPRFQSIDFKNIHDQSLSAPMERVACEIADYILNNVKPLIIRNISMNSSFQMAYDFIKAMQNKGSKRIIKISLIGKNEETLAEFPYPLAHQRQYIAAFDSQIKELQWFADSSQKEAIWDLKDQGEDIQLKLIKNNDKIIITNLKQMSYEEIARLYEERHPPGGLELQALKEAPKENMDNQLQWLKNRLKQRALMFFPSTFSVEDLEKVLRFQGYEGPKGVHLQVSENFEKMTELKRAIDNINSLDISNFQGKKTTVFLDVNSD